MTYFLFLSSELYNKRDHLLRIDHCIRALDEGIGQNIVALVLLTRGMVKKQYKPTIDITFR